MSTKTDTKRKLLIFLIDGFRWDYFDLPGLELSGFQRLISGGVKAEYLVPDFPTLSFPNYYSLMTGLHVEDHGFVGNCMYNKELGHSFNLHMDDEESNFSHWFEGAEPLWVTAEKRGMRTYFGEWPGAHVPNKGITPTMYDRRDDYRFPTVEDASKNLEKAVELFSSDTIDVAGVYLCAVDNKGHAYGPDSPELKQVVQETDTAISRILDMLRDKRLDDKVNIVIFSDHGMTEISKERTIDISEQINSDDIEMIKDKGPVCSIWPKDGKLNKVYDALCGIGHPHIKIYKKEDIPDRFHYKHKLVAPIIAVADIGWYILIPDGKGIAEYENGPAKGYHGYDNIEKDMRGIFLAKGPDFKEGHLNGPIRAVDVYQVMWRAIGGEPLSHKGHWSLVQEMFK